MAGPAGTPRGCQHLTAAPTGTPLGHLLRKYGTHCHPSQPSHCSLNQTFNFGISNRHQSPSQSVMYYKLYGCSGSRRRLKSVQEAVVIRTVNTVVGAGLRHKPTCLHQGTAGTETQPQHLHSGIQLDYREIPAHQVQARINTNCGRHSITITGEDHTDHHRPGLSS